MFKSSSQNINRVFISKFAVPNMGKINDSIVQEKMETCQVNATDIGHRHKNNRLSWDRLVWAKNNDSSAGNTFLKYHQEVGNLISKVRTNNYELTHLESNYTSTIHTLHNITIYVYKTSYIHVSTAVSMQRMHFFTLTCILVGSVYHTTAVSTFSGKYVYI